MLGFNPSFSLLSFPCLTRASKRHKAEPHDMYIESNALQQRFMPQPVLRSSWLQLVIFSLFFYVMFGLEPDISFRFPCFLPLSHPRANVARSGDLWIVGSSPTMTVLFFFCHPRTLPCHIRAWPEYLLQIPVSSTGMTEEKKRTRQ